MRSTKVKLLPPEGILTCSGMSESIVSYLLRTAETNCIGVGTLLRLAMPRTKARHRRGPFVNTKFLMRLSEREKTAYELVQQTLPGVNLGTATLNLFGGLCSHQKLYRPTLAWSPQFLRQRSTHYYPLIWLIDAVRVCPVTREVLRFRCSCCGRHQVYLLENILLGSCISCGTQFDDTEHCASEATCLQVDSLEYELWAAEQVRAWIEYRTTHGLPEGFSFSETLRWWLDARAVTSLKDASSLLGVPAHGISVWLRCGYLPRLRTLLQMCHGLRTGLVGFILRHCESCKRRIDIQRVVVADVGRTGETRLYRKTNPVQLREHLRQILNRGEYVDRPLTWICREQLNAGIGTVYRYCRKEALAVAARFKSGRRTRVEKRNEAFVQEMRAAAFKVVESGRVPRHDTLAPFLSHRSWLWRPWAKRALSEIRGEMGFAPLAGAGASETNRNRE